MTTLALKLNVEFFQKWGEFTIKSVFAAFLEKILSSSWNSHSPLSISFTKW